MIEEYQRYRKKTWRYLPDTAITTKNGGRNVIFQTAVRLLYFVLEREYTAAETTVFLLAVGRYMDSG